MEYEFIREEVTKTNGVKAIKDSVKARLTEILMTALIAEFGEDAVAMIRTGNTTKVNEIGVIVGEATNEGETAPIVVTVNPTVKEFATRKTDKRSYEPFDFAAAKAAYDTYIEEKEVKAAEAAEKKAKKIAADEAARAKAKAAKEAEG